MNMLHSLIKSIKQKPENFSHLLKQPENHRLFIRSSHSKDNLDYDNEINTMDNRHNQKSFRGYLVSISVKNNNQNISTETRYYEAKDQWNAIRLAQYDLKPNENIHSICYICSSHQPLRKNE